MDWTSIIASIISAISTIMVVVVTAKVNKSQKEADVRAERRKQESILSLSMMSATMELSLACCNALTGGHNNGNVEAAKQKALKAEEAYKEFERKILAEEISG